MQQSTITIDVRLDESKIPESISWNATDSAAAAAKDARAIILSFWDGAEKSALRMDLWTKDMRVDEMADFYFQTFMTMADSFERATHQAALAQEVKKFAAAFYKKFQEQHLKDQQH